MSDTARPLRAVLFDAYGTLLDVHGVARLGETIFPGSGDALSVLWREKQLQYSWLRTMAGKYADFRQVTGDALDYAAEKLGLALTRQAREQLVGAYERLTPFPDAPPALAAVARLGVPLAVLSNGTSSMLEAAFRSTNLRDHFAALLSVEAAGHYKTSPEAYRIAMARFGGQPRDFVLVSSNGWDVAGAAHFGFRTFWVNRLGAPVERMGAAPSAVGTSLADLAPWLAAQTPT
ncbi:MAG TPA: haloacid dehalogenase type II [Bauldia sp.]|nr:haloacid dehalogenase type II [Bauldia sp.]